LPAGLIAQHPLPCRDASRLLLLTRELGIWADRQFRELPELLRGDELVVFNNVRVLPARLLGRRLGVHAQRPSRKTAKEHLTGNVEVFLTRALGGELWEALVHPGRKMPVGERVRFGEGELQCEIMGRGERGLRRVRFLSPSGVSVETLLERLGHVPLPPYIHRPDEATDRERYQTVFAVRPGAVAAPTAGLHFTQETLEKLRARGCELSELTLHVGLGTFAPVHTELLEQHPIHAEWYEISEETTARVVAAKKAGRPVLAVGTTVVRALEDAAARKRGEDQWLTAGSREAEIFILPGHRFRIVDQMLTNFHLPRSTLLALVAAFAGRERILAAYHHAVEAGYRFYSYGDCMFLR